MNKTKPVFYPIHNLSKNDLKVFKEYIKDCLGKGYIQPFMFFFSFPILFMKSLMDLYIYI